MQSFLIAFNAILPITIIVSIGYFLKEKNFLDKHSIAKLNVISFKFFLPALTFSNLIHTNLKEVVDIKLLLFVFFSILIAIFLSIITVPRLEKNRKKQGSIIQAIYRSNFVILGIPISTHIAGNKSASIAAILITIVIPTYNVLAVIILSMYGDKKDSDFKKIIKNIITNPLILGSVSGMLASFIGLKLPSSIDKAVIDIAKLGSVLPLLLLGAGLDFSTVSSNLKDLYIGLVGRLLTVPFIFLFSAYFLGFEKEQIVALIAVYCSPVAVSSAIMAELMGCDGELSTQLVIFSTVFSCFTIFFWIFGLSFLNII